MNAIYPWSAVVGQEPLKLALLLSAIDPSIGGVLVRGPRGVAKTTLARALAELVPGRFVELPLGATEDRVTGSLDLGGALREGKVEFAPGLLARAHQGVLYVDEVNLLPDALVDLLLDAASSGVNVVERDGISQRHAARFVLIGTMNPEEGEIRPQLTDRFGLAVSAQAEIAPAERAEIVARRLDFDGDAQGFVARYARAQSDLLARCAAARERLHAIALAREAITCVTERCHREGVEGMRADIAMLRAARAHAAWHARSAITLEDIEAVAELALAHRRTAHREPNDRGGAGGAGGAGTGASAAHSGIGAADGGADGRAAADGGGADARAPASDGEHGGKPVVPVRAAAAPLLPEWWSAARRHRARPQAFARRRGAVVPLRAIDWFATLARSRAPRARDLRYRVRPAAPALVVLALDCSASMLRGGALAAAKGVARALATAAGRARAELSIIAFSGARAGSARRARVRRAAFDGLLDELGAGGGTPLRGALMDALALGTQADRRGARDKRLVLLTDGRSREPIADLTALQRAFEIVLVDCERTRLRLARARDMAHALGARYVHVDALREEFHFRKRKRSVTEATDG